MSTAIAEKQFFGHPRGLSTLFLTEMWERFSYYGMRGLLLLYMTDLARGGMGLETTTAAAIYGLYTFAVYALALPGGWIADRVIGQRKAVLYGGIIIAMGHYSMAIPTEVTFFLGLFLIVLGTGLLKPNVSAIVADLYPEGGARRDAGFSVFYMGINIGAVIGPTICSFLGEGINWHLGFSAAGVGMTAGIIQYVVGQKYMQGCGELTEESIEPAAHAKAKGQLVKGIGLTIGLIVLILLLNTTGILPLTLVGFAQATGLIVVVLALLYFTYVILFVCRDDLEKKRVLMIALLFVGAAMFWSGFEQAGSSMNLFARDFTDRTLGGLWPAVADPVLGLLSGLIGLFGWTMSTHSPEIPASLLQNINPTFIIILAPVAGMLWVKLGSRNPSIPVKFALGLMLLGVGFLVLAWGSQYVNDQKVAVGWLVTTYFFHTVGELCLSPVGLSSVTKLSPDRLVGQMMGTWFMGAALGNLIAGLVAGYIDQLPVAQIFATVAMIVIASGFVFLLFAKPMKKLMGGIE